MNNQRGISITNTLSKFLETIIYTKRIQGKGFQNTKMGAWRREVSMIIYLHHKQ